MTSVIHRNLGVAEIGAIVCEKLKKHGIEVVLTGGSVVSIYSHNEYQSFDLDFIIQGLSKRVRGEGNAPPIYKICLRDELARAMRLNAASLSKYLSGKQIPSHKAAEKILEHLGLPPDGRAKFIASLAETHRGSGKRVTKAFRNIRRT